MNSEVRLSLFWRESHKLETNPKISYFQEVNARLTRFEAECKEYREKSEKAQNQVQKQDTETQQLYAQLNEKGEECEEYKSQIDTLLAEKHDLEKRLKITGVIRCHIK